MASSDVEQVPVSAQAEQGEGGREVGGDAEENGRSQGQAPDSGRPSVERKRAWCVGLLQLELLLL